MTLLRPRINDYYGISLIQSDCDFAIPFLDEDIPLFVDPFLLWKSPSQQDVALHGMLVSSFNKIGERFLRGEVDYTSQLLIQLSECHEVGLGDSRNRRGKPIGVEFSKRVLNTYLEIPLIRQGGLKHLEELQLCVPGISKDRISDITCNVLKSFLIDYTIQNCKELGIPLSPISIPVFQHQNASIKMETTNLPVNPETQQPIILVPKRWMRFIPWINYEDYFRHYLMARQIPGDEHVRVLTYNRDNYDMVRTYIESKERTFSDCKNDPLFTQLPIISIDRKLKTLQSLSAGTEGGANKSYEDVICQMMASLLYPNLDFAQDQVRTIDGTLIRDLMFYNNTKHAFLADIYKEFDCKQMVIEIKNVKEVTTEHVNQLNRYLCNEFGRFGLIVTRNATPKSVFRNTIDLWAGQRKCIIILNDNDLKMMCGLFKTRQREPIDVLIKVYAEFKRACPS